MANRVFQNVVYQMKDAIDRVVGVVDETGAVIACSELGQIGEMREGFAVARLTAGDAFEKDGYAYHERSSDFRTKWFRQDNADQVVKRSVTANIRRDKVNGKAPGIDSKKIISYLPDKMYFADWMKISDLMDFFEDFYEDFDRKKQRACVTH